MGANKPLTRADGAKFNATIEETPDGMWQAYGVVRLDTESEVREHSYESEAFRSEEAARAWTDRVAMGRECPSSST
jgi:hypothetical protein